MHHRGSSHILKGRTIGAFGCAGCDVQVFPHFVDPTVLSIERLASRLRARARDPKC